VPAPGEGVPPLPDAPVPEADTGLLSPEAPVAGPEEGVSPLAEAPVPETDSGLPPLPETAVPAPVEGVPDAEAGLPTLPDAGAPTPEEGLPSLADPPSADESSLLPLGPDGAPLPFDALPAPPADGDIVDASDLPPGAEALADALLLIDDLASDSAPPAEIQPPMLPDLAPEDLPVLPDVVPEEPPAHLDPLGELPPGIDVPPGVELPPGIELPPGAELPPLPSDEAALGVPLLADAAGGTPPSLESSAPLPSPPDGALMGFTYGGEAALATPHDPSGAPLTGAPPTPFAPIRSGTAPGPAPDELDSGPGNAYPDTRQRSEAHALDDADASEAAAQAQPAYQTSPDADAAAGPPLAGRAISADGVPGTTPRAANSATTATAPAPTLSATHLNLETVISATGATSLGPHPPAATSATQLRLDAPLAGQPAPPGPDDTETAGVQTASLSPDRASIRVRILEALENVVSTVVRILPRVSIPSTGGPAALGLAVVLVATAGLGFYLRAASFNPAAGPRATLRTLAARLSAAAHRRRMPTTDG